VSVVAPESPVSVVAPESPVSVNALVSPVSAESASAMRETRDINSPADATEARNSA
jgi:hypothetical protein